MLQILYFLAFLPRIAQISDGSVPSENVKYFMVGPETEKKWNDDEAEQEEELSWTENTNQRDCWLNSCLSPSFWFALNFLSFHSAPSPLTASAATPCSGPLVSPLALHVGQDELGFLLRQAHPFCVSRQPFSFCCPLFS